MPTVRSFGFTGRLLLRARTIKRVTRITAAAPANRTVPCVMRVRVPRGNSLLGIGPHRSHWKELKALKSSDPIRPPATAAPTLLPRVIEPPQRGQTKSNEVEERPLRFFEGRSRSSSSSSEDRRRRFAAARSRAASSSLRERSSRRVARQLQSGSGEDGAGSGRPCSGRRGCWGGGAFSARETCPHFAQRTCFPCSSSDARSKA